MRAPRFAAVIDAAMMVATVATQEMVSAMAPQCAGRAEGSDLDLAAELDHAVGRQLEEFHRAFGVSQHPGEQFFAPNRHPGPGRSEQGLASEEEARVHHLALRANTLELSQR